MITPHCLKFRTCVCVPFWNRNGEGVWCNFHISCLCIIHLWHDVSTYGSDIIDRHDVFAVFTHSLIILLNLPLFHTQRKDTLNPQCHVPVTCKSAHIHHTTLLHLCFNYCAESELDVIFDKNVILAQKCFFFHYYYETYPH